MILQYAGIHTYYDMFLPARVALMCFVFFYKSVGWFPLDLDASKTVKGVVKKYDLASHILLCCEPISRS